MNHMKLPECRCPHCDHKLDAATSVEGESAPGPGDVTVCFYCTAFLVFGDALTLRLMTTDEIGELDAEVRGLLVRLRKQINARRATA